ncbi:uncharacterized protein BDCG_03453 [Blastomyces dermatitidis ER-3]|uniref:Uncharacterized protein n=1 Tax=Ajellomyces dermatitidis (strain ER-3 / ATCC MYA-2586) TaxID=559297 RepID=A0ABP2EWC0_AJEDR|nr:uncharacterized protein BDCG_03453 [Blastomyces dermatitidis ER-3]EEQ88333.2 hypothetical protein BDCG_03453 [Blastomyces dermatitidis ER-3]
MAQIPDFGSIDLSRSSQLIIALALLQWTGCLVDPNIFNDYSNRKEGPMDLACLVRQFQTSNGGNACKLKLGTSSLDLDPRFDGG